MFSPHRIRLECLRLASQHHQTLHLGSDTASIIEMAESFEQYVRGAEVDKQPIENTQSTVKKQEEDLYTKKRPKPVKDNTLDESVF